VIIKKENGKKKVRVMSLLVKKAARGKIRKPPLKKKPDLQEKK